MYRWTRLSSQKWEDAWIERLRFLCPQRVVFVTWPNSRALKIEAYCDEKIARKLVKTLGGRATKLAPQIWSANPDKPRVPLSIRGKLKIFSDEPQWEAWGNRKPIGLLIPAGMAFGTGEHATTATCLRLLCDLAPKLGPNFSALDLGCGSGILGIAAEKLGAKSVFALDFDPACIRITRQNFKANACHCLTTVQGDVLKQALPKSQDIVLANLYSDLLVKALPRIARSLKTSGTLIFSGVLRKQSSNVAIALKKCGFSTPRLIPRGKWCAGTCKKSPLSS